MKGHAAPFRWHWRMAADVDVDQVSFIEIAAPLDGDHSHFDQSCPPIHLKAWEFHLKARELAQVRAALRMADCESAHAETQA